MSVEAGTVEVDDREKRLQQQLAEEKRLAVMMIPKKKKRLYQKIMYKKKKSAQEVILDNDKCVSLREKTNNLGFRPGLTQTRLYSLTNMKIHN